LAPVRIARVIRAVQDRVASYILTVAQINLGVGLIVAGGAWAFGFAAPIMWGGLAFALNFLPYLGPLTMAGLIALVGGHGQHGGRGRAARAGLPALHATEANFVTPSIRARGSRSTRSRSSSRSAISRGSGARWARCSRCRSCSR
jgi:predicted PurR-regulated permease PerM